MAVSQDIQDFCSALPGAVAAFAQDKVSAALAAAAAEAATAQAAAVAAAVAAATAAGSETLAQVQQDHADEVAALKAALATATTPTS